MVTQRMDENLALALFVLLPLVSGGLLVLWARSFRRGWATTRWIRLLIGNLLVLLLLLSLVVLAGEIYYRYVCDDTDFFFSKMTQRWFLRHWRENSLGYRDNVEYANRLEAGRRRVTFLGDSFTAAEGVKDIEARFANRIRRLHPEWEVHVLARPGFDTGDELKALSDQPEYQIDEVVLIYTMNDICDLLPEWAELVDRFNTRVRRSGWLRRNSYLVNTLYSRFLVLRKADIRSYFSMLLEAYRGPVWEQHKQRLKAMRDLVQSRGGRLCVVTFPSLDRVGDEYQLVHDRLDQCWPELNVPHLDLLSVFRNVPARKVTVNQLDSHPNEYAHQLAADAIDKFLRQQMAVRR
jgi:hypothetical protein